MRVNELFCIIEYKSKTDRGENVFLEGTIGIWSTLTQLNLIRQIHLLL